jgi:hypothetical protein
MSSTTGVPVLSYGRNMYMTIGVAQKLGPDYDVVHACLSYESAMEEIPALLAGDLSILPSSGFGSNLEREESERRMPRAVFCGAGVPQEEVDELRKVVAKVEGGGKDVIWIKVDGSKGIPGGGPPPPDVVVGYVRELLKEAGL